jgi:hypothetical protein
MDSIKFFGIIVRHSRWLIGLWLLIAVLGYILAVNNPDSGYFERFASTGRNMFFYTLFIYSARKIDMASISLVDRLMAVLNKGVDHPHYGIAVLGLCVYYAGIIFGGGTVLVSSF